MQIIEPTKISNRIIQIIKSRKIITNPRDTVRRTWLKNHPSLGESDQVVWKHSNLIDEFEYKYSPYIN
jgi:hypothetical protein